MKPFAKLAAPTAVLITAAPALAVSLGEMAQEAQQDLELIPGFISIGLYIIGALVVVLGLLKLKRHMDQPQQTTLGSGLVALIVGVALVLTPAIINGVADTFGLGGANQTVARPKL